MIDFEVGQIPAVSLGIQIKDDNDNPVSLLGYPEVELELLGSDNERVDLTGAVLQTVPTVLGQLAFVWPKDRSLFTKKGKYLLRVALRATDGSVDYTRAAEIRVREFGRLN
jgi:hypothetical protein